jgi:hypothetical protein
MRYFDDDEAKRLNAEQWQLDLLKANPSYCSWGPHEDYMIVHGDGWNSPIVSDSWSDFGPWELDDLNECAGFYFEVDRESQECGACGGNGYHPLAQEVVNGFYSHMNERGEHWNDKITQDEFDALLKAGRVQPTDTVASVNAANAPGARRMGHDAINRMILTEARLARLGLPKLCPECEGHGSIYTAPTAHVSLVLWWMHPRKGASRGIEVKHIQRSDLPAVQAFLRKAADRNTQRFAGVDLVA